VWVEVHAHDTGVSLELVLWMLWVLESVTADETCCLLKEIVRTITNAEEILVSWIPNDGSYMFLLGFWSGETPQWQDRSVVTVFSVFSVVLIIFVILELFIISVLNDHSLHNLECSLHGVGIEWILNMLLLDLNWLVLVLFVFHGFFDVSSLDLLVLVHVSIKDLPLSGFSCKVTLDWWISLDTFLSDWKIESLVSSLLEVELIPKGLLLSLKVVAKWVFFEFSDDVFVHVGQQFLVDSLFVIPVVLLVSTIVRVFQDNFTVNLHMENKMVISIGHFVPSIFEREL